MRPKENVVSLAHKVSFFSTTQTYAQDEFRGFDQDETC